MPVTVHVQTRLDHDLAKRLDERAAQDKITRGELLRSLIEAALDAPQPGSNATTDPLLAEVADAMGALMAKVDACHTSARRAHAAAKIAALMLLPADRRDEFIDTIERAVKS